MLKSSRAYSKAAFDYAIAHKEIDSWYTLCQGLADLSHKAFSNPTLDPDTLYSVFDDLSLTEGQKNWLQLMIQHHHLKLLPEVSTGFIQLYQKQKNIVPVKITTAKPLSEKEKKAIQNKLEKRVNTDVITDFTTNPAIIGGVQFEMHGKLIDHSLALVLNQIHTE